MRLKLANMVRIVIELVACARNATTKVEICVREMIVPESIDGILDGEDEFGNLVRQLRPGLDHYVERGAELLDVGAVAGGKEDYPDCPGTIGTGDWVRIRNDITIHRWSSAFVMPDTWLPGIELKPSAGSKRGQAFVGVTNNTAQIRVQ